MAPLVVGFDLDMTLVDSRPGIKAVFDALSAETGVPIDSTAAVERLGPPLDIELALWFPEAQVDALRDRFRELYPTLAVARTEALRGAREAIEAVHRAHGRVLVVTAKHEPNARLHLEHLGLAADELAGGLWGSAKAEALRAHSATVYVGDHLGDIDGARAAGATMVAVATGPISAEDLRAAGADVVLDDLVAFPGWLDDFLLETRLSDLDARLSSLGRVTVAFSGGTDSAFLLAAAADVLGPQNVLAATAVSSSLPSAELAAAAAFVQRLGVRHLTPQTNEIERDGYVANAGDRCYFCKAELLDVVRPLARAHGHDHVATGTNADDARAGFRPGIRAAAERGAVTPLLDVGLTKAQVREASRRRGLPTWDKPAAACLSSRIAYGVTITPSRLARVERAETSLRSAMRREGIEVRDLRVRDLGGVARVEVDQVLVDQVRASPQALQAVLEAGFDEVEVDPRGFRSGSMNELLAEPDRFR